MKAGRLVALVAVNVRRARGQFLLSAFGIAVGVGCLAFFLALSGGVRRVVLGKVFHVDRIEVVPDKAGVSSGLGLGFLGGGPRPLSDDTVKQLAALDGVRSAAPRIAIGFPAKAWGGAQLFGQNRYAELIGEGLDPSAVAAEHFSPEPFADLEGGRDASGQAIPGSSSLSACTADADCRAPSEYCAWDVHQCQKPVPALVSRVLLELYNGAFAPSHGLPRISDFLLARMQGFTFTVELGASFVGPSSARGVPRQRRVMIIGVSDRAVPIGLSVPLPYVRRWNAEYAGAGAGTGFSSVTLDLDEHASVTAVAAKVRELGLSVVDSGAEQAGLAITLVTLLLSLVSLAIVGVASINIAHTFYRVVVERRREIGVMRAVGASALDVQALLLGEAAAMGAVGGVVGLVVAYLSSLLVDLASRRLVPPFPFKPDTYFAFSSLLVVGVFAFALLACVCGALLPARSAARLEPARALTM